VATHLQQSDDAQTELVKALGIRAYVCNPLIAGDKLLGTLSFASRSRDEFEPLELDFLQTICHHVTAAYERVRLVQQLLEANRRKDEFLATLAHELRNPLAPIRNALSVLNVAYNNREAFAQATEMMSRQLAQMVRAWSGSSWPRSSTRPSKPAARWPTAPIMK
jgi:signal transduction histidine kinase